MGISMSKLYKERDIELENMKREGQKAGWNEEKIEIMCDMIVNICARNAAFYKHNTSFDEFDENEYSIDVYGKQYIEGETFEEPTLNKTTIEWIESFKDERLKKVLYCLSEDEIESIQMKYLDGYSFEEICIIKGVEYYEAREGIITARKYAKSFK